jgi:L-ascorbate metabolism protein UlaG (beta-lactamase superfamily)
VVGKGRRSCRRICILPETAAISPDLRRLAARFKLHVALMPIGAYEPEWFMTSQHVNPEEAMQAFLDVGAETHDSDAFRDVPAG